MDILILPHGQIIIMILGVYTQNKKNQQPKISTLLYYPHEPYFLPHWNHDI